MAEVITCKYCARPITRFLINNRTPAYSDDDGHVICDAHPYTTDPMLHVPDGSGKKDMNFVIDVDQVVAEIGDVMKSQDNDILVDENGEPSEKIVVLAHNFTRYIAWCKRNKINYRSLKMKFVYNSQQLLGYSNMYYVDLGINERVRGNENFYATLATRNMHQITSDAGS